MKACGYSWYDSKKCNGTKYNITNYEKKNFINSEKNLYDAIKEAVKKKFLAAFHFYSYGFSRSKGLFDTIIRYNSECQKFWLF